MERERAVGGRAIEEKLKRIKMAITAFENQKINQEKISSQGIS